MIHSQSTFTRYFALFVMLGCFVAAVTADEEIKFPTQTAECVVSVADENGKPIAGATIKLYGCRCVEEPTTGWAWPISNVGKPQEVTTDAQGKASVVYPIKFGADPDWMTTSEVSAMVGHPEFISKESRWDPRDGVAEIMLRAGCQLTLSAVDSTGAPIEFGILMAGPGRSAKWVNDESGAKRSRAIPDGVWQTMLVSPGDDGKHLFSSILPIQLRDNQDVSIRNIQMRPGRRVRGRLSEDVARPIANGKIVAHCLPKPAGQSWGDKDPSVSWETAVTIDADGTFEFPSLPRTGLLQLIAVCQGYVGTNTNLPGPNRGFTQGLFADLDELDEAQDVTIPMAAAGAVQVTVLRPDGQPLSGADVIMCPNEVLHLTGSTILGESWESIEGILVQLDPQRELPTPNYRDHRYSVKTDDHGIATIGDLPIGRNESIYISHKEFVIPSAKGGHDRRVTVSVPDTNPVAVEIKLVSLQSANEESANRERAKAALDAAAAAAETIGGFF